MCGFEIQPAKPVHSANLAILADMATRRLSSYLWGRSTSENQTPFEFGRSVIYGDQNSPLHHRNWRIAWAKYGLLGAINGYILSTQVFTPTLCDSDRVLAPLNELKAMAIGTWYISALAVFPEARGIQVGKGLLHSAEHSARLARADKVTLMVGSFNSRARSLYESMGYVTRAKRAFEPFAGSDRDGLWILMSKSVKGRSN